MDIPRTEFLQARRKRRALLGAVGALAIAGVAYAVVRMEPVAASANHAALLIDTVERGEFVRQVRGPGVLIPEESRSLAAQAPGRVERILLKPGRVVEPDSIIAVLDNPDLERVVQEAQWALAQGEAEVAAMKLQLKSQVLDQKSRVAEARANALARQRAQLDSLQVRAGMRGVVQALPVQMGQQIAAGTQIARVAQLDKLIAELKIPELQAKDLAIGLKAQIDTRSGIIPAEVSRVDPAVEHGTVRVECQLLGTLPAGARPDLSVDGVIEIERTTDTLYVARPAAGDPDSTMTVFKLDADGTRARRTAVQLGKASVNEIQVMAGLAAGDRIIVSDVSQWSASDELRIR